MEIKFHFHFSTLGKINEMLFNIAFQTTVYFLDFFHLLRGTTSPIERRKEHGATVRKEYSVLYC